MARDSDHDESTDTEPTAEEGRATYECVNIGSETLPPDLTEEKMARLQGFDTVTPHKTEKQHYEELTAEAERESMQRLLFKLPKPGTL